MNSLTTLLQRLASLGAVRFCAGMIVSIDLYCTQFYQNPQIHITTETGTRVRSGGPSMTRLAVIRRDPINEASA